MIFGPPYSWKYKFAVWILHYPIVHINSFVFQISWLFWPSFSNDRRRSAECTYIPGNDVSVHMSDEKKFFSRIHFLLLFTFDYTSAEDKLFGWIHETEKQLSRTVSWNAYPRHRERFRERYFQEKKKVFHLSLSLFCFVIIIMICK